MRLQLSLAVAAAACLALAPAAQPGGGSTRRAGAMRLWATIAGQRTNTVEMRILPKRC